MPVVRWTFIQSVIKRSIRFGFGVFIKFIYGAGGEGVVLLTVRDPIRYIVWSRNHLAFRIAACGRGSGQICFHGRYPGMCSIRPIQKFRSDLLEEMSV